MASWLETAVTCVWTLEMDITMCLSKRKLDMIESFFRLMNSGDEFDSVGGGWRAAVKVKGLRWAGNLRFTFLVEMVVRNIVAKPCLLEIDVRNSCNR